MRKSTAVDRWSGLGALARPVTDHQNITMLRGAGVQRSEALSTISDRENSTQDAVSTFGHKRTLRQVRAMSALPPKAGMERRALKPIFACAFMSPCPK